MECKNMIVLFKKDISFKKVNYVFDEIALVDKSGKIMNGKYKDSFVDDFEDIDLYRHFVNGKFDNYWVCNFDKREDMPNECYSVINFNYIIDDDNVYDFISNLLIEGKRKHLEDLIMSGALSKFILAYIVELFDGVYLRDDEFGYSSVRDSVPLDEEFFNSLNDFINENDVNMPKGFNLIIDRAKEMLDQYSIIDFDAYFMKEKMKAKKDKDGSRQNSKNSNKITTEELVSIINDSKDKFIGQEAVIDDLAMNIYLNTQIIAKKSFEYAQRNKSIILLDGPTGTGKTAILQDLSNKMSIPFVKADATSYTSYGYKGASLTDILRELLVKTNGNVELAQEGIICLDEFDKLASPTDERGDQIGFKKSIQHELLKFGIDGKYNVKYNDRVIPFDTSKITMIYMGAFTKLREKGLLVKRGIGFNSSFDSSDEDIKENFIDEHALIKYGYERELIGRIKLQVTTKKYTEEDLKNILLYSKISPLLELDELFGSVGKAIKYDNDFVDAYASYAYRRNTGARALQKIADEIRNMYLSELLFSSSKEINLTGDMIKKLEQSKGRRLV